MSTRVVVALHVAWMAVLVGLALWAGWLFRFEGDREFFYLDRWTGDIVDGTPAGYDNLRLSLRAIKNKPSAKPGTAPVPGVFDDLIPKK